MTIQTEFTRSSGRLSSVIGLNGPLGYDGVGSGSEGVGHEELEFACCVSARGEAGAVVAFDVMVARFGIVR